MVFIYVIEKLPDSYDSKWTYTPAIDTCYVSYIALNTFIFTTYL
jgi:hypothetical protein